jgi:hypothetical protein
MEDDDSTTEEGFVLLSAMNVPRHSNSCEPWPLQPTSAAVVQDSAALPSHAKIQVQVELLQTARPHSYEPSSVLPSADCKDVPFRLSNELRTLDGDSIREGLEFSTNLRKLLADIELQFGDNDYNYDFSVEREVMNWSRA